MKHRWIRNCPFCGKRELKLHCDNYTFFGTNLYFSVECKLCGARGPEAAFNSISQRKDAVGEREKKRRAIQLWNSRTEL